MKKARRQYKVAVYMGEFNPTVFCGYAVSLMDSALKQRSRGITKLPLTKTPIGDFTTNLLR